MTPPNQNGYIPFALPDIGDEEISEVVATLRSGWITSGPRTAQFEAEFREYIGVPHALAVNSCTAGLHLALKALGLGPGDEAITTPLTFCATINAILETGATPVLADVGEDLNLDPDAVRRAITPRTKAIVPVHLGGLPCDMDSFWRLARERNLHIVEDAAHAVGAAYAGRMIGGGESAAVAFSFYATKNLTTGEGGMVTTASKELADRMRVLCLHGINRDAWNRYSENGSWYYEVTELGYKYNLSDIQAAIGIHQLRKLDRMNARRIEIAAAYDEAFGEIAELQLPPTAADRRAYWQTSAGEARARRPVVGHSRHLYILRLNLGLLDIDRARFFEEMTRLGIGCSVHFIPIPLHPYYRKTVEIRDACRRALAEYPRLISLPLYSRMSDADVNRVIAAVRNLTARHANHIG